MEKNVTAKPFVKWAGGKGKLIDDIMLRIEPIIGNIDTYVEPFAGGGAMAFYILSNYKDIRVVINDLNSDLINTYKAIKTNVDAVINELGKMEMDFYGSEDKKGFYYAIREKYNSRDFNYNEISIENAVLFIFLNKTCFNGIYRVNSKNGFNVPWDKVEKPGILDENNLKNVNALLENVTITNYDYERTLEYGGSNSLFYFDPPYKPISKTSSFNSYNSNEFNDEEQIRLKKFCDILMNDGSKFILSNSDPKSKDENCLFFDELYKDYIIERVFAKRSINANGGGRGKINELLIRNF